MTAPVVQEPVGNAKGSYHISFVLPSKYTLETVPRSLDPRVRLRTVGGRMMAARTYSGTWSQKRYRENEAALLKAVRAEGLAVSGDPVFARYNPPYTPWPLRRNEVLIEIKYK